MSVRCECCVLSGRGLYDKLITRPEESYRVWCVWVWSRKLMNEETIARVGPQRPRPQNDNIKNADWWTDYLLSFVAKGSWFDSRPVGHCGFPLSFNKILGYCRKAGLVYSLPLTFHSIIYIYSLVCLRTVFTVDNQALNRARNKFVAVVQYVLIMYYACLKK